MSYTPLDAKEILAQTQKRHLTEKRAVSVKLDERIFLHLADHKVGFNRLVDTLVRKFLTELGIDLSKTHPEEIVGYEGEVERGKDGRVKKGTPIKAKQIPQQGGDA